MARILVLDDERSLLSSFQLLLEASGHEVLTAELARGAILLLESHKDIDVVIADVFLPDMSGALLLDVVTERWPQIKVILITGAPTLDTAMRAVRTGAHDFLYKPIQGKVLREAVASALRQSSLEKQ